MNFKLKTTGLLVICFALQDKSAFSQISNDPVIEQIIESIAENASEDLDYSELTERLYFYRKNPLPINTVSRDQLRELIFLSPLQINTFLLYRKENGSFADVLELQVLSGFDLNTIRWLLYFVTMDPPGVFTGISLKDILGKGDHDIMIRIGGLQASAADLPDYSGSGLKIFTRYRYNYSHKIAASLNLEKDAGEKFFSGIRNKGFDFYSANVSIMGKGIMRKLLIGDYALQFGQGLSMWSGLGFGKGSSLTGIAKQDLGLRPYSSANESSFLRGISASLAYEKLLFTPFVSYKKVDANISQQDGEIKSLIISGLHRTQSEIENKNSAAQLIYGSNLQFRTKDLTIGLTTYRTRFNLPIAPGNLLYQRFEFSGSSLTNLGLNYSYALKNTFFFGEVGHSLSAGSAYINALMSSLSRQVSVILLHRSYARNYHSFFNQAVSESTGAVNEKGFYAGLTIKFDPKWELITYSDLFRFPWLKFRIDAPSSGYELFGQLSYNPNKRFKMSARYKQQSKEENNDQLNSLGSLESVDKQNYRLEINYKIGNAFILRYRAEIAKYKKDPSKSEFGFLSYQDVIYDPLNSKISGNIRFAIFDTQGFNSRIYAYENDVLYSYSVPAYQGKGLRYYLNARYNISRGLDLWLRYAIISYSNPRGLNTGPEKAGGADIRFQLRYRFNHVL